MVSSIGVSSWDVNIKEYAYVHDYQVCSDVYNVLKGSSGRLCIEKKNSCMCKKWKYLQYCLEAMENALEKHDDKIKGIDDDYDEDED